MASAYGTYQCSQCPKFFHTEESRNHHELSHNGYNCNLCDEVFYKTDLLSSHYVTSHNGNRARCKTCKTEFKKTLLLNNHIKKGHCKVVAVVEQPTLSGGTPVLVERAPNDFSDSELQLSPSTSKKLKLSETKPVQSHQEGLFSRVWPILLDNTYHGLSEESTRDLMGKFGGILAIESLVNNSYFKIFFATPGDMITAFKALEGGTINGRLIRVKLLENRPGPGHYQNYLPQEQDEEDQGGILSEREMNEIREKLVQNREKEVSELNGITIRNKDLLLLADGIDSWLNDDIIDFYLSMISQRSKELLNLKIYPHHVSNLLTYFSQKLFNKGYGEVKNWLRRIDLFDYGLVFLPIPISCKDDSQMVSKNKDETNHWILAVIDTQKKEIRSYDPKGYDRPAAFFRPIFELVQRHHLEKRKENITQEEWRHIDVKEIPQQGNDGNCGVFSCLYAEHLSRGVAFDFSNENMLQYRFNMLSEIQREQLSRF